MNRRQLGLGLVGGGAVAALGACAAIDPMYQGTGPRPAPAPMSPSAMSMAMGADEQRHVMETALTGQVALRSSQLALQRTQNPGVRQFATFEVEEQTGVATVLQELSGMAPPPLDPARQAILAALEPIPAGPAFDRAYLQAQLTGHQELLEIQDDYLRVGRNPHNRHVALLARGRILEHITDVNHLTRMM